MAKSVDSPKSFEDAISELEGIVREMEQGSISLEQALEQYQKGIGLLKYCQSTLDKAEQRIQKLEGGRLRAVNGKTAEEAEE